LKLLLVCGNTEGLQVLVAGKLNDFKLLFGCKDTEGLHALVAGELNNFK